MIARRHALDDRHAPLGAALPDDLVDPLPRWPLQDLVAMAGCPNHVIPMVKCAMPELEAGGLDPFNG